MPSSDHDIKTDFNDAYGQAFSHWEPWLIRAERCMEFDAGKQWNPAMAAWLKSQRRAAKVFNKCRRIKNLITGYQRKNRLAMKIAPVEGSDEATASQLTGVIAHTMDTSHGYHILSDAFEKGPIITGLNLVSLYMDYFDDPLSGDLRLARRPYNRFLLDPKWSDLTLRDCRFVLCRDYLDPGDVKALIPKTSQGELAGIKHGGRDDKYIHFQPAQSFGGGNQWRYDEFWTKTKKEVTVLVDPKQMEMALWQGPEDRLRYLIEQKPDVRVIKTMRDTVNLDILVEDRPVYSGPAPQGIDEYPFVPLVGYFTPEQKTSDLQLQSVFFDILDPQEEVNNRRSKMIDILDSQISNGWEAFEDTLVNPKSLYQAGQAQVIWKKKLAREYPPSKIQPSEIPQGLFNLNDIFEKDIYEIPGANEELFGQPSNNNAEVASMLAKQRQGAGLTTLQALFDNYRLAKKILGQKKIKMIQKNYSPQKVARILGQPPTREFFSGSFGKYDCTPVEGVLSDSQRQMHYAQLFALKVAGAPIPWAAIIDAAPIEKKEDLKKMIAAEEKAAKEAQQAQQQALQLDTALKQAKMASDNAGTQEKLTQAQENRSGAVLDRAKTLKEIENMDVDQVAKLAELMKTLQMDAKLAPSPTQ